MTMLSNTITILAVFAAIGLLIYLGIMLLMISASKTAEHRLLCFVSGVIILAIPVSSVVMALASKGVI